MKRAALLMVTYGDNWEQLNVALRSIYEHTTIPYHLFLFCNEPRGNTIGLFGMDLPNTSLIKFNKQLYWGGAINMGFRMSKEYDYVFMLNDDIEVWKNWDKHHIAVLDADPKCGAVGPINSTDQRDWQGYNRVRTTFKDLKLPALENVDRANVAAMNAELLKLGKSHLNVRGMLAFFCTGFRRDVIDRIGELDPFFDDKLCGDDDDYCARLQKAGYHLSLLLNTYVAHYAGFSVNEIESEHRKWQKAEAVKRLREKHG